MRIKITLSIAEEVIKKIDKARGMIPRSRWVECACIREIERGKGKG